MDPRFETNHRINLQSLLWIVLLGSYLAPQIYSANFFGELLFGRYIQAHWKIPAIDIWTELGNGRRIWDLSWLFNLVASLIETHTGEKGLRVLMLLTAIAVVGVQSRLYSALSKERFIGAVLASIVSCGILTNASFDARLWGLIFTCVQLVLAYSLLHKLSPLRVLSFFGVSCAHVNLYAPTAFWVSLIMLFFLRALSGDRFRVYLLLGLAILSQFVTPYVGTQIYAILKEFADSMLVSLELRHRAGNIFHFPVAFLLLVLFIIIALGPRAHRLLGSGDVVLLLVSVVLSFVSLEYVSSGLIISGLLSAKLVGRLENGPDVKLLCAVRNMRETFARLPSLGVLWILLCAVIVNLLQVYHFPLQNVLMPVREVDYVVENNLGPILHERSLGAYLAYRFSDSSGLPINRAAFAPWTRDIPLELLKADAQLSGLGHRWQTLFNTVGPTTVLCVSLSPLYELLKRDRAWQLSFRGGKEMDQSARSNAERPFEWAVFEKVSSF